MKKLLMVWFLCFTLIGVALYLWQPGGPLNPHDWISEHYTPAPEIDPNCKPNEILCPGGYKDMGYSPLHIELINDYKHESEFWTAKYPIIRPGCWNIDFCTKHSEVRVTSCAEVK